MRKLLSIIAMSLVPALGMAQEVVKYKTIIYTSRTLPGEIQRANDAQDDETRGFASDLLNASVNSAKGIGAGYVTSFIDMGVNAIASLVTSNARHKEEWEKTVTAENSWTTKISSVQDVKDFYQKPSTSGALDPMNMSFDGIGCLRKEGNDTVFFVSCHIDRSKLYRIINHSKFELVLDTLIINPMKSNLPNTQLPIEFSFKDRKDFTVSMTIKLTSSWFTDAIELHSDAPLGEFSITVPVSEKDLDATGTLKYARQRGEASKYAVVGESFIVPRSYMGFRDKSGNYNNIWGTGQYKLEIELKETCGITQEYRDNWKSDRKQRNAMKPKTGFFSSVWQTVSSQQWDEIAKQWVITTLSAPAGVLSNEIIDDLGLESSANAVRTAGASTVQ